MAQAPRDLRPCPPRQPRRETQTTGASGNTNKYKQKPWLLPIPDAGTQQRRNGGARRGFGRGEISRRASSPNSGLSFRPRSSLALHRLALPLRWHQQIKAQRPLPSRAFRLLRPPKGNPKTFGSPGASVSAGWGEAGARRVWHYAPLFSLHLSTAIVRRYLLRILEWVPRGTPGLPRSVALNASAQDSCPLECWDRSRGYCPWC